jgi:hypothetical protein
LEIPPLPLLLVLLIPPLTLVAVERDSAFTVVDVVEELVVAGCITDVEDVDYNKQYQRQYKKSIISQNQITYGRALSLAI